MSRNGKGPDLDPLALVRQWQEAQKTFWSAAGAAPAFADASDFAAPDWQAFDALIDQLFGALSIGDGPAWQQAHRAMARYRDVMGGAWARVQTAFEAQRQAMQDPSGPSPDWRVLRDRWFDLAEAEFIRTQRSPEFLEVLGEVVRSGAALWRAAPPEAREAARMQRETMRTAMETMDQLGIGGVAIAETAKDLIWQEGKVTLSHYRPFKGGARGLGPVLICHGLIGRQTMTDLRPERSMVRQLLAAGVDVFVLDWGSAGPEDADLGMDHYAGQLIPAAIRAALAVCGAERLTLFGICQGGTMAACHAARRMGDLSGLILAVAPIDFQADVQDADPAHGLLNLWIRSLSSEDHEALLGMEENLSGEFLGQVFNQLNPVRTLAKYSVELMETGADLQALTTFVAMEKWLADRPDLPGALARAWLGDLYRDNALVEGHFVLCGAPVDLAKIDVPVLNVFATGDHIVPPPCSRALGRFVPAAAYEELALPSGHIGAFVGAKSQALLAPAIKNWLARLS